MGKYSEDITLLDVCPFSLGIGIEETKFYKDFGLSMDKIKIKALNYILK